MKDIPEIIYVLYSGYSTDGKGTPFYLERTTDRKRAKDHWLECVENPYSLGYVAVLKADSFQQATSKTWRD